MGLEIARRALAMSQFNLRVIAHNIANSGTPGFSRQRAELIPSPPLPYPSISRGDYPQQLGTGVDVDAVRRIRDEFLDEVIRMQTGAQGRNETVEAALGQVELIFNEPGEYTLGTLIDNFFAAWQDLANNPELVSTRANLREQGISLVREINRLDTSLRRLREEMAAQLKIKVGEANDLAHQISDLNIQISQVQGLGENPNDLMDQRDLLAEELSEIIPVTTIEQLDGSMSVLIGGLRMVEMDKVQELEIILDPHDPEKLSVRFKNRNLPNLNGKGVLAGLIEVRDEVIPFFQSRIDNLTTALVNRVNVQHLRGFGLDGLKGRPFFEDRRTAEMLGTVPLPVGTDEDTPLDELGITAGTFTIQGATITLTPEDVAPGEAITLGEVLVRITDSQPYVRARLVTDLGPNPYLRLDLFNPVESDTTISILWGTSSFLTVTGLDSATTTFLSANEEYSNSSHMMAMFVAVLQDLDVIAAAGDDGSGVYPGPGNNLNALAIASLQSLNDAVSGATYTDYYASTISELGSKSQSASRLVANQDTLLNQLYVQRESIRGVSLDEEATYLITYQRIYEGAARVTQVIDSTLDTLINRTGA
jgi:flagellar hook-associated protein 1 FlgK